MMETERCNQLTCPKCDFTTSKEKRLVKHVRKAHKTTALRCPFCVGPPHYCSSAADLPGHKKRQHGQVRLRCFLCEFGSRSLKRWSRHVTQSHGAQMLQVLVGLARDTGDSATVPLPSHSDPLGEVKNIDGQQHQQSDTIGNISEKPRKRKCLDRQESDLENIDLKSSKRKRHYGQGVVDNSQKQNTQNVLDDKRGSTDPETCSLSPTGFSCALCEYSTPRSHRLHKHMERKHSDSTPEDKLKQKKNQCRLCPYCSSSFLTVRLLDQHCKAEHFNGSYFTCESCDYQTKRISLLIRHLRCHSGEKPFACHICPFKTSVSSNLTRHMKTHTGEKPYVCHLCPYKTSVSSNLTRHMKTHTGEKPYACLLCSYKASQQPHLKKHMRIHTGEKPYACHMCPYKASQKCHLESHLRRHRNEKPYKCSMCSYAATVSSQLTVHIRTHTKEKPYECKLCLRRFTYSSNLSTHVKNAVCI